MAIRSSTTNKPPQEVSSSPHLLALTTKTTETTSLESAVAVAAGLYNNRQPTTDLDCINTTSCTSSMFPLQEGDDYFLNDDVDERRYKDHSKDPLVNINEQQQQRQQQGSTSSSAGAGALPTNRSSSGSSSSLGHLYNKMKTVVHFPSQLHIMLSRAEEDGYADIVSWHPHGRSFMVRDRDNFVSKVMPLYFRQTKFSSFQRQLNLYGYIRMSKKGQDYGGYYHELFLRSRPDLCQLMGRVKSLEASGKLLRDEPDFYSMEPVGFVPGTGGDGTTGGVGVGGARTGTSATVSSASASIGQGTTTEQQQQQTAELNMMRSFPLITQLPEQQHTTTAQSPLPHPPVSSSAVEAGVQKLQQQPPPMPIFQQGGANLEAVFSEMFPLPLAPREPKAAPGPATTTTTTSGTSAPQPQVQQQLPLSSNLHNSSSAVGNLWQGVATASQAGSVLMPQHDPHSVTVGQQQQQQQMQQGLAAGIAPQVHSSLNISADTLRMLSGGASSFPVFGNTSSARFSGPAPAPTQQASQPDAADTTPVAAAPATTIENPPKRSRSESTAAARKQNQEEGNSTVAKMPRGLCEPKQSSPAADEAGSVGQFHDFAKMKNFLDDVDLESDDEQAEGGGGPF